VRRALRLGPPLFALLAASAGAAGQARLDVAGSTEAAAEFLDVRVDVTNRGATAAAPVTVEGELMGRRDQARLDQGVGPGETRSVLLRYPRQIPRPGTHALLLQLDYSEPGRPAPFSQRAYLLLALGGATAPPVRLHVGEIALETAADLRIGLESADGEARRVEVSVAAPRGLRPAAAVVVDVPASGRAWARVRLLRGAAPRGSSQGVLVIARAEGGERERTAVAMGTVRVLPDPAVLPRLRPWLLGAAVALLLAAAGWELLLLWRQR